MVRHVGGQNLLGDRIPEVSQEIPEISGHISNLTSDSCYLSPYSKTVLGLWLTEARVGRLRKKHDNRLAKKYAQIWKNGSKMEEIATQLVSILRTSCPSQKSSLLLSV